LRPDVFKVIIPASANLVETLNIDNKVSSDVISLCERILVHTVIIAVETNLPFDDLIVLGNAISTLVSLSLNVDDKNDLNSLKNIYENYVDNMATLAMSNFTSNEPYTIIKGDNLVTVVQKIEEKMSITSLGPSPHKISFPELNQRKLLAYDGVIGISVTRSQLYETYSACVNCSGLSDRIENLMVSNPLRFHIDCLKYSNTLVELTIQNNDYQNYNSIKSNDEFKTTCYENNRTSFTYKCSYPDSIKYEIVVNCDGIQNATYITKCPDRIVKPTCNMISSYGSCSFSSASITAITCSCNLCQANSSFHYRNLQQMINTKVTYSIVSVTQYIFEDYVSTMEASKSFNKSDIKSTTIIIISFATVWIVIILSVAIQGFKENYDNKKNKNKVQLQQHQEQHTVSTAHINEFKEAIKSYIISYFPAIYKSDRSFRQLLKVILLNHQYFSLLTNSRTNLGYSNRWIQGLHLLSIISSNMFVLAMLFDTR
jgi:hypothetical protein